MHFCLYILSAYLNDNHGINACIFCMFLVHIIPGPNNHTSILKQNLYLGFIIFIYIYYI
jgi:hypothetical protein